MKTLKTLYSEERFIETIFLYKHIKNLYKQFKILSQIARVILSSTNKYIVDT
jgi:hypothetical protein